MLNNLGGDPGPALLAESAEQMKVMGTPNQTEAVRANIEKTRATVRGQRELSRQGGFHRSRRCQSPAL